MLPTRLIQLILLTNMYLPKNLTAHTTCTNPKQTDRLLYNHCFLKAEHLLNNVLFDLNPKRQLKKNGKEAQALQKELPSNKEQPDGIYKIKKFHPDDLSKTVLADLPSITVIDFSNAEVKFNRASGQPFILIELNQAGKEKLAKLTKANIGKPLAIVLNNKVVSTPVINEVIDTGRIQVGGALSLEDITNMVNLLKSSIAQSRQK